MIQRLTERVGVVPGGTNVGIVRVDDRSVFIIDSGLNDTTARKVLREVRDELQSEIIGILTTHAHADHFGAHAFVVKRTGARVLAPAVEATTIEVPILQPAMLYGGADPADGVRTRFLLAEACRVDEVVSAATSDVFGVPLEIVALPGHSINQFGYIVDGTFFCADVVFPSAALAKYPIPYLFGLSEHLKSMARSRDVSATAVVPGHGPVLRSLDQAVDENVAVIERVCAVILESLDEATGLDDVCAATFATLNVPVFDPQSFYLLRPTMLAYLAHLERTGVVTHFVDKYRALWVST